MLEPPEAGDDASRMRPFCLDILHRWGPQLGSHMPVVVVVVVPKVVLRNRLLQHLGWGYGARK